jgi:phage terminase small subunit
MALTQKQENFCLAYIKTGNASEAYRQAYNAEKMKSETINEASSRLLADSKIATRVKELTSKVEKKAIMSATERMELLSLIANNVTYDKDGNAGFGDATKAIEILNKMDGIYIQKNQTELSGAVGVTFQIDLGDESN